MRERITILSYIFLKFQTSRSLWTVLALCYLVNLESGTNGRLNGFKSLFAEAIIQPRARSYMTMQSQVGRRCLEACWRLIPYMHVVRYKRGRNRPKTSDQDTRAVNEHQRLRKQ